MLVIRNNTGLSLVLVTPVATQFSILWQVPKEFPHPSAAALPLEMDVTLLLAPGVTQEPAARLEQLRYRA